MYTLEAASSRFGTWANDTTHFVCVAYGPGGFAYAGEGSSEGQHPFEPRETDLLVARFQFQNADATFQMLARGSSIGVEDPVRSIKFGYLSTDLNFSIDSYGGVPPFPCLVLELGDCLITLPPLACHSAPPPKLPSCGSFASAHY